MMLFAAFATRCHYADDATPYVVAADAGRAVAFCFIAGYYYLHIAFYTYYYVAATTPYITALLLLMP